MSDPLTGSQTWAVVITGIFVVFVILLILVALCTLMSNLVSRKKKAPPARKEETPAPRAAAPAPVSAPAAPMVESGVSGEVVAAITAAVACMLGPDQKFAVRSVKRVKGTRPAWSAAGVAENTRPF